MGQSISRADTKRKPSRSKRERLELQAKYEAYEYSGVSSGLIQDANELLRANGYTSNGKPMRIRKGKRKAKRATKPAEPKRLPSKVQQLLDSQRARERELEAAQEQAANAMLWA